MNEDRRAQQHEDMSSIMASIRRLVEEEDRRVSGPASVDADVFELTADMRVLDAAEATALDVAATDLELSVDEAQIADIARAVLREEFAGDFGRDLTRKIRTLVREEVAQAIDALGERR
jgi:hypothetical protein